MQYPTGVTDKADKVDEVAARAARARQRSARMVIHKTRLGEDVHATTVRGAAAVALAAELSAVAWTLSGRTLPPPRRRPMPIVFERRER